MADNQPNKRPWGLYAIIVLAVIGAAALAYLGGSYITKLYDDKIHASYVKGGQDAFNYLIDKSYASDTFYPLQSPDNKTIFCLSMPIMQKFVNNAPPPVPQ